MQIDKILNEKEVERIEKIIEKNYGVAPDFSDFVVFITSKEKIWIVTKKFLDFYNKIEMNAAGLYIGKLKRNDKIHLSLEGMHLFLKKANKNIVKLSEDNMKKFMQGFDVSEFENINCDINNFVLVKHKEDFVGTGILREGKIENLLPKSRRIYEAPVV